MGEGEEGPANNPEETVLSNSAMHTEAYQEKNLQDTSDSLDV